MKFYNRAGELFEIIDLTKQPKNTHCMSCNSKDPQDCTHALKNLKTGVILHFCGQDHLKQLLIAWKLHNFVEPK